MTRDDLRGIVEGISDEQLKKILDIHSMDIGKAKGEREELLTQLNAAEARNAEMTGELEKLKIGQCEADNMKIKIEELQKIIDQRAQADESRVAMQQLKTRFDEASGGRIFVNEITQRGVFDEFCAAVSDADNAEKSDAELYAGLVADRGNLFAPEGGIPAITGSAMGFGGDLAEGDVREIMGLNY